MGPKHSCWDICCDHFFSKGLDYKLAASFSGGQIQSSVLGRTAPPCLLLCAPVPMSIFTVSAGNNPTALPQREDLHKDVKIQVVLAQPAYSRATLISSFASTQCCAKQNAMYVSRTGVQLFGQRKCSLRSAPLLLSASAVPSWPQIWRINS